MGHGSLSVWVTGSWVTASDPLPALARVLAHFLRNIFGITSHPMDILDFISFKTCVTRFGINVTVL